MITRVEEEGPALRVTEAHLWVTGEASLVQVNLHIREIKYICYKSRGNYCEIVTILKYDITHLTLHSQLKRIITNKGPRKALPLEIKVSMYRAIQRVCNFIVAVFTTKLHTL